MASESKATIEDEERGLWPIVNALTPIQQIRASRELLSDKNWGLFFYRFAMFGMIFVLTSAWIIAQFFLVLNPMVNLSGPPHEVVLGFLGRLVLWGALLYGYVWLISRPISDITERTEMPEPSDENQQRRYKFALLIFGGFFVVFIGPVRYAILTTSASMIVNAQVNLPTTIGRVVGLLMMDMIYGGVFMLGFGFVMMSVYVGKKESQDLEEDDS